MILIKMFVLRLKYFNVLNVTRNNFKSHEKFPLEVAQMLYNSSKILFKASNKPFNELNTNQNIII